ncbi:spermatogenesis-associated protein 7 isoform X2 [Trichomycterus rosablanca]|uniref:spermatogenesis-associated protein 7 isoform X2 n=1 Tax=Trichomycterus rosablanca TaxID=2290929 RepID=UPI002F360145
MGYRSVVTTMDAKRAFCPGSSGKLTNQLLIKDHMISHYKKVYSAKAAVDCSVPKSMQCSIKYRDQKRREQMKKDSSERVQSVRPAANGEESALFYSGGSALSSPRFNTSFPSRQIVYPSQIAASPLNCRPASESSYRSPKSQRLHFTQSSATSSCQEKFRSFQDPTQKTYSGDILLKHAHNFTQEKPFTPRTLKTHCKSNLSTYRYYTPPKRKEEKTRLKCNQQDTHYESKHSKSRLSEQDFPKPYSVDPEWSDDETNISRHYRTMDKSKDYDFFLSSSRISPEGMKSPIMRKVTAEEEELMYLEFVTDVTNEIIARGIYSDRVLKRVFERHIEINKQRLNEDKMRHLLDALQNDLQSPPSASVTVLEQKDVDSSVLFRHKYSSFAQDLDSSTTDPTLNKGTEEHKDTALLIDPDPVNHNILHEATPRKEDNYLADMKPIQKEGTTILQSTELKYRGGNVPELTDNPQPNEEDKHQNNDELVNELDELGRNMAESLNLSDSYSLEETTELETSLKLSDDEF